MNDSSTTNTILNFNSSQEDPLSPSKLALSISHVDQLIITGIVVNSLSIIGCLFNVFTPFILKRSSNTVTKMVVSLGLMDLIFSGFSLVDLVKTKSNIFCQIMTFGIYFGYGGSLAWTVCFAHGLYTGINRSTPQVTEGNYRNYSKVSIAAALLLGSVSVAIGYNWIDKTAEICWHPIQLVGFDWTDVVISGIPPAIAMGYSLVCYLSVMKHLKELGSRLYMELLLYPAIVIITSVPWIALTLYVDFTHPAAAPFAWQFIANVFINAQGLLNAFAYGLSSKIINGYREICCRRKRSTMPETEEPQDPFTYVASEPGVSESGERPDLSVLEKSLVMGDYVMNHH